MMDEETRRILAWTLGGLALVLTFGVLAGVLVDSMGWGVFARIAWYAMSAVAVVLLLLILHAGDGKKVVRR
jgi:hypothetical protein